MTTSAPRFEVIGLTTLPEIEEGDDLADVLADAWRAEIGQPLPTDILVVTQKVVSKAEGCLIRLDTVEPSPLATVWAGVCGKDPRLVEIILRQSRRMVRMDRGLLITETVNGLVCANAGVDTSNVKAGHALTMPRDPDRSAVRIREQLAAGLGVAVAVVITDTFGRPWREGLTNVAIGLAGVRALSDYRGHKDTFGRTLEASILAAADEVASAAELVMCKSAGVPAAVVRGLDLRADGDTARSLVRPADRDLFR